MSRIDLNNLQSFIVVARERSFTRAAAQLGVSQSALSHSMRALETKLGVRLLARSTRGVAPTEAGERLLLNLSGHFEGIEAELASLDEFRGAPSGSFRITAFDHPADTVLWPKLSKLLRDYPAISVEIDVNYVLVDIVAERFDAGVRFGDQVAKDMIAVRIAPDQKIVVVGTPEYLAHRPPPASPRDLGRHDCVNLRLPTRGGLYEWEFIDEGKPIQVAVRGQFVFSNPNQLLKAALAGFGLAYVPEDMAIEHIAAGRLTKVLEAYCPTFPGYHLYYPSRRQSSPGFILIVEALRYKP